MQNWLDDITIPPRTCEEHLELLRETFDCLRQSKLSTNLPKSDFFFSVVEWLGMIIDRFGIRPAPSKIEAITQLSQNLTVEEVGILLGIDGYLRKFVPNYSSVLAPISDLLRDSRFHSKKARRLKVPWGQTQTEAMKTLVSLLTSHQSSRYPTGTKRSGYTRTPAKHEREQPSLKSRKWLKIPWHMQATDDRKPTKKSHRLIGNA